MARGPRHRRAAVALGRARRAAGSPERRGFGTRVLEDTVRRQLGGHERRIWAPEGLVCKLEVPAERLAPAKDARDRGAPDPAGGPPVRRRHAATPSLEVG